MRLWTSVTLFMWVLTAANLLALGIWTRFAPSPSLVELSVPVRTLVLAAHQDDGVIMAGGALIQNARVGGRSHVAFLTRSASSSVASARREEAHRVWGMLGEDAPHLTFLDFESAPQWPAAKVDSARAALALLIEEVRPERVFAPLVEGGQVEHDLLGRLAREVVDTTRVEILQAAEYNPYFLAAQPSKLLGFVARLLPFAPHRSPPRGLDTRLQGRLRMTPEELELKREMLLGFVSQRGVIPLKDFGYPDLYDGSRTLPQGVVTIGGKHLSYWAVATLASLVLSVVLAGGMVGARLTGRGMVGATVLLLAMAAWSLSRPRFLLEELLLVLPVLPGLLLGAMLHRGERRAAPKTGAPQPWP